MIYRVPPNYPGVGRARLSGLPAARRLRRDEPGPPPAEPLRLLPAPGARRRRQRRSAPQVLRRVQRRARHARRVLPRHHQDRVPGIRAAERHLGRATASCVRPQDIKTTALLHHRRRARRHLRRRPDRGRARSVHRHPEAERSSTSTSKGAGHYGIFSGRRWREIVYPQVRDFIRQLNRRRRRSRSRRPQGGGSHAQRSSCPR